MSVHLDAHRIIDDLRTKAMRHDLEAIRIRSAITVLLDVYRKLPATEPLPAAPPEQGDALTPDAPPAGEGSSSLPPSPATEIQIDRAGHIGPWVRSVEKADETPPAGEETPSSPAPRIRDQVQALHDAHPEYTARQAREALGLTKGSLSGHSSALGIQWTPVDVPDVPVEVAPKNVDRVRLVHDQHPTWTARMIANQLGEKEKTVANILGGIRRESSNPEFAGKADLVEHYDNVAKRLGKV